MTLTGALEFSGDAFIWELLRRGCAQGTAVAADRHAVATKQQVETTEKIRSGEEAVTIANEESVLAREVFENRDRFQILYERYYERILNFCYRRVRDRALAEDLTSQVFLSAMEYLRRRKRDVHFRPWLYRIATNAWLSHERSRARRAGRWISELYDWINDKKPPRVDELLSDEENQTRLRHALMQLPAKYREPILLKYDEELKDSEIAAALGLTQAGVRSRLSRGISILRKRVSDSSGDKEARR